MIYLGNKSIDQIYVGDKKVVSIWLGDQQIYTPTAKGWIEVHTGYRLDTYNIPVFVKNTTTQATTVLEWDTARGCYRGKFPAGVNCYEVYNNKCKVVDVTVSENVTTQVFWSYSTIFVEIPQTATNVKATSTTTQEEISGTWDSSRSKWMLRPIAPYQDESYAWHDAIWEITATDYTSVTQTVGGQVTPGTMYTVQMQPVYLNTTAVRFQSTTNDIAIGLSDTYAKRLYCNGRLYYSTDNVNFQLWDGTKINSTTSNIYLKGVGNTYLNKNDSRPDANWYIESTGDVTISGKLEDMLDCTVVRDGGHPTAGTKAFYILFAGAEDGSWVNPIVDIQNLIFPTTAGSYAFHRMFYRCSRMVYGPKELPALTVSEYAYFSMFQRCTSLVEMPYIRATSIGAYGCYVMFYGCTALTKIHDFVATTFSGNFQYGNMFENCTALMFSETQDDTYKYPFKLPGDLYNRANEIFNGTGGTYTGDAYTNRTYYTPNYAVGTVGVNTVQNAPAIAATNSWTGNVTNLEWNASTNAWEANLKVGTYTVANDDYSVSDVIINESQGVELTWAYGTINISGPSDEVTPSVTRGNKTVTPTWDGSKWIASLCDAGTWTISATGFISADVTVSTTTEYNITLEEDVPKPFYVTSATGSAFSLNAVGSPAWSGYYKVENGQWIEYTLGNEIAFIPGQKVYIKGTQTAAFDSENHLAFGEWFQYFEVGGNIMSLWRGDDWETSTSIPFAYAGYRLFANSRITIANLKLPATDLTQGCYYQMFADEYEATLIDTIPQLPATYLVHSCYYQMFAGCFNLKLAEFREGEYTNSYRIPTSGTGTTGGFDPTYQMFIGTGGTFAGSPTINVTYYTSNTVTPY